MHLALLVALVSSADGDVDAAKRLREAGKGATLLELSTSEDSAPDEKPTTYLRVEDPKAIAALLALIKTKPVNAKKFLHHMCIGHPVTRLSKDGKVLALFSFDHVKYLRPYDERWPGDAELLPASARALAAWYAKYGYTRYADEFKRADDEVAAIEAYFAPFPPVLQRLLRTNQSETVSDADAKAVERETPDPVKRFTVLCEGLSRLTAVRVLTFEHQTTFALTGRLSPAVLEKALLGFDAQSAAAKGAARFLFEQQRPTAEVLAGVPMDKARAIVAKYAALHFADPTRARMSDTAFQLRPFFGVEVEKVLRAELARPLPSMPSRECYGEEPSQLGALVVLSAEKALSEQTAPAFESVPCEQDRGVVAVARALRTGRLPALSDFEGTPRETMKLFVQQGLKLRRDRAAIELAVGLIDKSVWVMWELVAWLDGIMSGQSREPTYEVLLEVKAWWERTRAAWPE